MSVYDLRDSNDFPARVYPFNKPIGASLTRSDARACYGYDDNLGRRGPGSRRDEFKEWFKNFLNKEFDEFREQEILINLYINEEIAMSKYKSWEDDLRIFLKGKLRYHEQRWSDFAIGYISPLTEKAMRKEYNLWRFYQELLWEHMKVKLA